MARTITIDPVTRIEGHARVLLDLDDGQQVKSARLVVNELRGFERMLVGMEADRMPLVTARICGVCPVPHALASTKALETAFRITPPPAGVIMRRLISLGHVIHSHALHLFALGGPDLYFGLSADPAIRNVVGLVKEAPELAKKALRLRTLGQRIVETVGGRGIHPVTVVLGGVSFELSQEERDLLRRQAAELVEVAKEVAPAFRELLLKLVAAEPALADAKAPMHDVGLLAAGGKMDHYDGALSLGGPDGGNGGNGGDVVLVVDPQANTLLDYHRSPHRRAENGRPGAGDDRIADDDRGGGRAGQRAADAGDRRVLRRGARPAAADRGDDQQEQPAEGRGPAQPAGVRVEQRCAGDLGGARRAVARPDRVRAVRHADADDQGGAGVPADRADDRGGGVRAGPQPGAPADHPLLRVPRP